jgi:hypothetical protein
MEQIELSAGTIDYEDTGGDGPVLVLPHGRLVEVADNYTLIPLDQPARLAQAIRQFTMEAAA